MFRWPIQFCVAVAVLSLVGTLSVSGFETNGDIDATFDAGKITAASAYSCLVQSDGKLLVIGDFGRVNEVPQKYLARFNGDGTLDTSFTFSGASEDFGFYF